MRISAINNNFKPKFGYDVNLNKELKSKLDNYPDRYWAATLATLNTECNAIENTIKLHERNGDTSRLDDYADIFVTLKQMLTAFISVTFDGFDFAKREIDSYQDEFVKRGSDTDDWRAETISALSQWVDDTPASKKENEGKELFVPQFDENGIDIRTPLNSNQNSNVQKPQTAQKSQQKASSKLSKNSFLEEYKPSKNSPNGFSDVAGMDKLKRDLNEGIIQYMNNPEQALADFEEYGKEMPKAILLYGPPGCGKTYITQALSQEVKSPLYLLNISKAGSSYINQTSQNIKAAFDEAIQISSQTDKPCLIFMDEIDTLGFDRTSGREAEDLKQVGTMLQSIDNAKQSNVILIGATNKYNILDPALRRRFESKIFVDVPDKDAIRALVIKNLTPLSKGKNLLADEESLNKIADMLIGYSNSSICNISKQAALNALRRDRADIAFEDYEKAIKESTEEKPKSNEYKTETAQTKKKIGF